MIIRTAVASDLDAMAAVAAGAQGDPAFHNPYLGASAESIAADVAGLDAWAHLCAVAEVDGAVVGWLLAEPDNDMGRVWWWGPFAPSANWGDVADALYAHARPLLPDVIVEEEACADERSAPMRAWAHRRGFHADPGSVLLVRHRGDAAADDRVRHLAPADHAAVMGLHALAFPGTHTTPAALVASSSPRLVIEVAGAVVGYVAYESQSDGSGYIDYLAVDPARRGDGLGGALVDHACQDLFAAGVSHVHLSVRADNSAARALYTRVGFTEDRVAVPYRLGFALP